MLRRLGHLTSHLPHTPQDLGIEGRLYIALVDVDLDTLPVELLRRLVIVPFRERPVRKIAEGDDGEIGGFKGQLL